GLVNANRIFGGNIINESNLDFEIDSASKQKKLFRKAAHLTRAMTSGHAFSDGNKRTAIVAVTSELGSKGLKFDKKKIVKTMINLSKSAEGDLNKIERKLRRCTRK
ncbi:hypothetical protein LCGC14_2381430, partial [marine sediment metagenome]